MSTQVHRFGDTVAAYIGTGDTTYMTPQQARELGNALIEAAKDTDNVKFTKSTFKTFQGRTIDDK